MSAGAVADQQENVRVVAAHVLRLLRSTCKAMSHDSSGKRICAVRRILSQPHRCCKRCAPRAPWQCACKGTRSSCSDRIKSCFPHATIPRLCYGHVIHMTPMQSVDIPTARNILGECILWSARRRKLRRTRHSGTGALSVCLAAQEDARACRERT
jgi:hypothetical protein